MPFHVLYVEDIENHLNLLRNSLNAANHARPEWSKVILSHVPHPSMLPMALDEGCPVVLPADPPGVKIRYPDVMLADIYFQPEGTAPPIRQANHLEEIIKHVRDWERRSPYGFRLPIIAYTGTGEATLKKCLERRSDLYDIWDKLSAGADYVAWRFQQLAAELPRHRPDATIQKLIASMRDAACPPWHNHVKDLVRNYGEGQTELEQVRKCRDSIQSIINSVYPDSAAALMTLWDVLADSEPILRAAAPKLRGIVRHSINVFWFGYWIINHPSFRSRAIELWTGMVERRVNAHLLKSADPILGMNAAWLLAALFHDAGRFYEKCKSVIDASEHFSNAFASLSLGSPSWTSRKSDSLPMPLNNLLLKLKQEEDDPLISRLTAYMKNTWSQEKPDHGAVASAHLINICQVPANTLTSVYAFEAARAVMLHSCVPAVFDEIPKDQRATFQPIEWRKDPIASLLLFCDQIQTWDRHDTTRDKKDFPDRAELSFLELNVNGDHLLLGGCINYIAPSRVDMYPGLREDIAEALNKVILEKPKDTLLHVLEANMWPFVVRLDCALSGEPLPIGMNFR